MGKNIPKERKEGMYKAILELKSLEECFDFFEDICAMTELRSMEQRFEVATLVKSLEECFDFFFEDIWFAPAATFLMPSWIMD